MTNLRVLFFLGLGCLIAGCGSGEPTVVKPPDSGPSASELEAFYNQPPEEPKPGP